tara:strand:- start:338 stop:544 length:207 start_codon:yes stop_codon:yes gene_type:complete
MKQTKQKYKKIVEEALWDRAKMIYEIREMGNDLMKNIKHPEDYLMGNKKILKHTWEGTKNESTITQIS